MEAKIRKIIEGWFIYENALFEISLTHALKENRSMGCAVRCGDGRIEYNPVILKRLPYTVVESLLKVECVRIILKHPYERQPIGCTPAVRYLASSIVIGDNYDLKGLKLPKSEDFGFPKGKSYEWYAYHLQQEADETELVLLALSVAGISGVAGSDGTNSIHVIAYGVAADVTALWHEDSFMEQYINQVIAKIGHTKEWGTIPGDLVQTIIADTHARIDYRKILSGFRMSVLSSKRRLTRMRPNRRTGFDHMGSIRGFSTRLLVAVDVSSSVTDTSLKVFFSVVNRAFRYGVEKLDLITFDSVIHDVMEYTKGRGRVKITGRGGTDFQPAIDYAHEHKYDGLLIFTDGEAPAPSMPQHPRFRVVWVFDTMLHYDFNHEKLSGTGRGCPIEY